MTLRFASGSIENWNADTLVYADGENSVSIKGVSADQIALKSGDDGSERFDALAEAGAFLDFVSDRVFRENEPGIPAGLQIRQSRMSQRLKIRRKMAPFFPDTTETAEKINWMPRKNASFPQPDICAVRHGNSMRRVVRITLYNCHCRSARENTTSIPVRAG